MVERTSNAAHGWPASAAQDESTDTVSCAEGGSPHLLDCGMDDAAEALQWFYGTRMQPPEGEGRGELMPFDQTVYYDGRRLADEGYVFVPKTCEEGTSCALSVVLHGCSMSAGQVCEAFVRDSGLNEWASQNRLVVLYPQAKPSLPNLQACWGWWGWWGWWGYDESSWQRDPVHDSQQGKQVQAIKAMVDQIASPDT
ncbi:esterase/PHB depolymerase [Modicisalibacter xianhensis]|uniref:Esterase/PHB depolymerase n=1 Tax=Modicisalibacter xianhensis TaxID=442341 RepID=A0A4R8FAD8_9GAMM|nr:PHB depolymerase family esterase [Halomonas xianhensis]TDX22202.1 esterase/PHB depolymerase [Halomonas xianhensis]